MINSIFLPSQGGYRTVLAVAMGTSLMLGACGGGQDGDSRLGPSGAAPAAAGGLKVARSDYSQVEAKLRSTRLCDLSGCYVAWNVVDSDGDGVCDADETMAGTDPYDPLSKPSLQVVAELSGKGRLPSFEAGSGVFAVFPEQMQTLLQEYYKAQSGVEQAFAFPLGRARGDSLTRAGIQADQLTAFGLDPQRDGFTIGMDRPTDSGLPARRVGGIDLSLVSADAKPKKEGEEELAPLARIPPRDKDYTAEPDPNGDVRHYFADGSGQSMDKNGKVLRVWYTNPDADAGAGSTEPTAEQKQAFERVHGAVQLAVEGWLAPEVSGEPPKDKKPFIMLLDPEYQGLALGMLLTPNLLTTAQPEVRPDLPRVDVPAGTPGGKDLCMVGCVK